MRRFEGRETWHRLLEWDRGSTASERLCAVLLDLLNYTDINPSHPLGGPDGKKDLTCKARGREYVVACYFPRGRQQFSTTRAKFQSDMAAHAQGDYGHILMTNQELTLGQRDQLMDMSESNVEIYHLEAICALLNAPKGYGIRLEYLDISMTKEEQLAYVEVKEAQIAQIADGITTLLERTHPEKQVAPVYVTPNSTDSFASFAVHRTQLHCCSYCQFGYLVQSEPISSRSLSTRAVLGFGYSYITCPKCGNAERYFCL